MTKGPSKITNLIISTSRKGGSPPALDTLARLRVVQCSSRDLYARSVAADAAELIERLMNEKWSPDDSETELD